MITICIRAPQRGNEMSAQGFRPPRNGGNEGGVKTIERPGYTDNRIIRPERAKECSFVSILLPFQGVEWMCTTYPGRCPGLTSYCPFGAPEHLRSARTLDMLLQFEKK